MSNVAHMSKGSGATDVSTLITVADVAARLGVSRTTVHRYAASGDLPYVNKMPGIRGGYLFDPAVVALFARQRRNGSRKKAS